MTRTVLARDYDDGTAWHGMARAGRLRSRTAAQGGVTELWARGVPRSELDELEGGERTSLQVGEYCSWSPSLSSPRLCASPLDSPTHQGVRLGRSPGLASASRTAERPTSSGRFVEQPTGDDD